MNKNIHGKLLASFWFIVGAMLIFLIATIKTINSDRNLPNKIATKQDRSLRGSIISADNYNISYSKKIYKAEIRGASIDPNKRDVFIKLFSIYSGLTQNKIIKNLQNKKGEYKQGYTVVARNLNPHTAMQLKSLARKLHKLKVFQPITIKGSKVIYGLDIVEDGELRHFPLKDSMSPILGYVKKDLNGKYKRSLGQKGIEKSYENTMVSQENGYFQGKRDVLGTIIYDKNTKHQKRVDGLNVHLNIPLQVQRRVEKVADNMKSKINADEVIVGIMNSTNGKLLALATSNRYDPSNIRSDDIEKLVPKFTEYPYEAGSVLKPITLAIALEKNLVTPNEIFPTFDGKMKIGKRTTITDDEKFKELSVTDIIVHSSNVGTSQIAWRLSGQEFRNGLLKFGVAKKSGIDLSRDLPGSLKAVKLLNHKLHRANTSYGYGMMITHSQLMKAYSAFNNDGKAVSPKLVDYFTDTNGTKYPIDLSENDIQVITPKTASQVKHILKEVVERGTGVKTKYPGLEIGGKTGTAHIAKGGKYTREYHSSFYGFANDNKGNKYTIGVLVIRAKKFRHYFASLSAVPTFRKSVEVLVDLNYLEPEKVTHQPITLHKPQKKIQPIVKKKKTKPKKIVKPKKVVKEKKIINKKKVAKPTNNENFEDLF